MRHDGLDGARDLLRNTFGHADFRGQQIRGLHKPMGGAADGPSTRAVDLVRWVADHRVPHELAVDDVGFWLQRISPRPTT